MARVTAYEASDGSLHRDRKAYLNHESNLVVSAKLKTIIGPLVVGESDEARAQSANDVHDFIVNGIGLNTLRDLFAVQFKPGAEDGEGAAAASTDGAPASGDTAPAPAAGDAAAGDAAPAGGDI